MTYELVDTFIDVEDIAKEWALSVPELVATVGVNSSGNPNIYLGMPAGSPLPALVLYRSGGGPEPGSDVPVDIARITFDCWASNRPAAKAIAKTLVTAAQSLRGSGLFVSSTGARLHMGQVLLWMFQPDTVSPQTPRYVVDIQFTVTAA